MAGNTITATEAVKGVLNKLKSAEQHTDDFIFNTNHVYGLLKDLLAERRTTINQEKAEYKQITAEMHEKERVDGEYEALQNLRQALEDSKRQRSYTTQVSPDDLWLELCRLYIAMGKVLQYTTLKEFVKELVSLPLSIAAYPIKKMTSERTHEKVEGLYDAAFDLPGQAKELLVSKLGALSDKIKDAELVAFNVDLSKGSHPLPKIEYQVGIEDATGKCEMAVKVGGEIASPKRTEFLHGIFMDWLEKNDYNFDDVSKGFQKADGTRLTIETFNKLDKVPGRSFNEYVKERFKVDITPERSPSP